jgi:hypothetical protein
MSNILRRPMFRGGRVESRGTGITSGLGYAAGGSVNTPKRGLVDGPGGYAGVSMSSIPKNVYNAIFGSKAGATGPASINTATTTGGQLLESVRPMQGPGLSPQMQAIENRLNPQSSYKLVGDKGPTIGQRLLNMGGRFMGANPLTSMAGLTAAAFAPVAGLAAANAPETIEELQIMKQYGPVDETWTEDMIQQYEADRALARKTGTPLGTGETGITSSDEELQKVLESQTKKQTIPANVVPKSTELTQKVIDTEEPELTVNDYIDLLGGKKAMQRDVGDMLGRASAAFLKRPARGETRGITEALGDFMAAEVAAGPGRREKIEQTAAMLDIKDKIASKRAKEQIELFKGQEDYRNKLATERAKGTIDDQYLAAKKTEGKPAATAIAIRNTLPGYQKKQFEVVEEKESKTRQITESDVGKVIIKGNKDGTYTAIEIVRKPDGTIGTNKLYTSP